MKQLSRIIIMLLSIFAISNAVARSEQWWSYLATYDDGPGSIIVDLSLHKEMPKKDFPYLIVTGTTYESTELQGLPTPSDLDRLNDLQSKVLKTLSSRTEIVHAGAFTYNYEQLYYIYVKDPAGLDEELNKLYSVSCPGCKTYTNIKKDESWEAYSTFLFPNDATLKHYGLEL